MNNMRLKRINTDNISDTLKTLIKDENMLPEIKKNKKEEKKKKVIKDFFLPDISTED